MAAIDSSVSTSPHVTPAEFAPAIPHVPTVNAEISASAFLKCLYLIIFLLFNEFFLLPYIVP